MLVDIEIEGPSYVAIFVFVPLESYNAPLESVHAQTIMAKLLIAVFNLIKAIHLVFKTDVKPGKF